MKLLVDEDKEAAAETVYWEVINGYSVVFTGAVVGDAKIPVWRETGEVELKKAEYGDHWNQRAGKVVKVIC